jgi:hypothetical protein
MKPKSFINYKILEKKFLIYIRIFIKKGLIKRKEAILFLFLLFTIMKISTRQEKSRSGFKWHIERMGQMILKIISK